MFSKRETKIIDIINNAKDETTVKEICRVLFPVKEFEQEIKVANSINRIIKKCEHFDLNWTISKNRGETFMKLKRVDR